MKHPFKLSWLVAIIGIGISTSCKINTVPVAALPNRPNIVLINVDDLGWADTEVYGSTFYETPHINRLATMGMRFTQAYAAAANCAPSRACLMSGQQTPRHGIYTVSNSDRGKSKHRKLISTPNTTILADSIRTIAEVLKSVGYAIATFGKWHLGEDPFRFMICPYYTYSSIKNSHKGRTIIFLPSIDKASLSSQLIN